MTDITTGGFPQSSSPTKTDAKFLAMRRAMRASTLVILTFFVGICGWLSMARLDSAALAPGILENATTTRVVQHLEGGIVTEILVRNGDVVAAGDLLLRLDQTRNAATAELYSAQLWSAQARQARLQAEVQLAETIAFPAALLAQADEDAALQARVTDERAQFAIGRETLSQSEALLGARAAQSRVEIEGHELRRDVAREELELVVADLEGMQSLRDRGLANQASVTTLNRDRLALEERIAQADIDIARLGQQIAGFELEAAQLRETYRQRAAELLEVTQREIRSLERDTIVASDALNRIEVRAPVNGTVQESILGTIGAVIAPAAEIMKIVPVQGDYVVRARVSPNDIESILPGSEARVTFPAFVSLEMPPAQGTLTVISRDRVVDERAQLEYYEAEIRLDESTIIEEVRTRLVAGMAVSTVLPTGERSALDYLLGPLISRLRAAMREE